MAGRHSSDNGDFDYGTHDMSGTSTLYKAQMHVQSLETRTSFLRQLPSLQYVRIFSRWATAIIDRGWAY